MVAGSCPNSMSTYASLLARLRLWQRACTTLYGQYTAGIIENLQLVAGMATSLVFSIYLVCDNAPAMARILSEISGAISLSLILVWSADLCWSCVEDSNAKCETHKGWSLPNAWPVLRRPSADEWARAPCTAHCSCKPPRGCYSCCGRAHNCARSRAVARAVQKTLPPPGATVIAGVSAAGKVQLLPPGSPLGALWPRSGQGRATEGCPHTGKHRSAFLSTGGMGARKRKNGRIYFWGRQRFWPDERSDANSSKSA